MRLLLLYCCLALLKPTVWATELSAQVRNEVKQAVIERFEDDVHPFNSVAIYQNPEDPHIFAVLWDDGFWFKCLRVIKFEHKAIVWAATLDPKSDSGEGDHAILNAGWKHLPNIGITVLEVYTSSHRGNGAYQLSRLDEQTLVRLLETRAIGRYDYE